MMKLVIGIRGWVHRRNRYQNKAIAAISSGRITLALTNPPTNDYDSRALRFEFESIASKMIIGKYKNSMATSIAITTVVSRGRSQINNS
jgi:hypothetical protein